MGSKYRLIRRSLLWICIIIGTLFMSISFIFLIEPTGHFLGFDDELIVLQSRFHNVAFFNDLYYCALILLLFIGIPEIAAGLFLLARMRSGIITATVCSSYIFIIALCSVIIFPNYPTTWLFLLLIIVELLLSIACYYAFAEYNFYFNENDYSHIGLLHNSVVIYYSNNEYIKKYAYGIAEKTNGELYEISLSNSERFTRLVSKTLKGEASLINDIEIDLQKYPQIYLVIPIWFNHIASPFLNFLEKYHDVLTNFQCELIYIRSINPRKIIKTMEKKYAIVPSNVVLTKMHFGVILKRKNY